MFEVGSASYKIAHVGSKMAGKEIAKAAETHGPVLKQEMEDFKKGFKELSQAETIQHGPTYDQAVTGFDKQRK